MGCFPFWVWRVGGCAPGLVISRAAPDPRACTEVAAYTRWSVAPISGEKPLCFHSCPDRRSRADAILKSGEGRPSGQVDLYDLRPVEDGEQVGVGDAEGGTHQEGPLLELRGEVVKARSQAADLGLPHLFGGLAIEEWAEAFVDFGGDEVEPLLKSITLHRSRGWGELRLRLAIGERLNDRHPLGDEP